MVKVQEVRPASVGQAHVLESVSSRTGVLEDASPVAGNASGARVDWSRSSPKAVDVVDVGRAAAGVGPDDASDDVPIAPSYATSFYETASSHRFAERREPLPPDAPGLDGDSPTTQIIVGLLDGTVVSLDANTGTRLWSFSSGEPLVASAAPSAPRGDDSDASGSGGDTGAGGDGDRNSNGGDEAQGPRVFPGADGSLYFYATPTMRSKGSPAVVRLPLTVRDLVDASPSMTDDGAVITASRRAAIYMLDGRSGTLLRVFEGPGSGAFDAMDRQDMLDFDGDGHPDVDASSLDPVFLGRAEYRVQSVDTLTGAQRWNVTYGEMLVMDPSKGLGSWSDASSIPYHPHIRTSSGLGQLLITSDHSMHLVDATYGWHAWRAALPAPPVVVYSRDPTTRALRAHLSLYGSGGGVGVGVGQQGVGRDMVVVGRLAGGSSGWFALPTSHLVGMSHTGGPLALPAPGDGVVAVLDKDARDLAVCMDRAGMDALSCPTRVLDLRSAIHADLRTPALPGPVSGNTGINPIIPLIPTNNPNALINGGWGTGGNGGQRGWGAVGGGEWEWGDMGVGMGWGSPLFVVNVGLVVLVAMMATALARMRRNMRRAMAQLERATTAALLAKEKEREREASQAPTEHLMERERDKENDKGKEKGRSYTVDGVTHVGKMQVLTDKILGYGGQGTIVFEGMLDGRAVAVKRMLRQLVQMAEKEVRTLTTSDDHPNIVRYFAMEEDSTFVYLALERCQSNLGDYVISPEGGAALVDPVTRAPTQLCMALAMDVMQGTAALHHRDIVHRDLKPRNVLLTAAPALPAPSRPFRLQAKISDMGLSRKLVPDQSSFETMAPAGSSGWQAPEQLRGREGGGGGAGGGSGEDSSQGMGSGGAPHRMTRAVDVFSMGCLLHYLLTGGLHPFGGEYERDQNIMLDRHSLKALGHLPEMRHLIGCMIQQDPRHRPPLSASLHHPAWWHPDKRLRFLIELSNRLENEDRHGGDANLVAALERGAPALYDGDWLAHLDGELVANLGTYRVYNGYLLRDLLRVIRNKASHYKEMPETLKATIGSLPEGFLSYFTKRFPSLLMHCYYMAVEHLSDDPHLAPFFPDGSSPLKDLPRPATLPPVPHLPAHRRAWPTTATATAIGMGMGTSTVPLSPSVPAIPPVTYGYTVSNNGDVGSGVGVAGTGAGDDSDGGMVADHSNGNGVGMGREGGASGSGREETGSGEEGGELGSVGSGVNGGAGSGGGVGVGMGGGVGGSASAPRSTRHLFPRREGAAVCDFFKRVGYCRYGSKCHFDHPPEFGIDLNALSLPLRPSEPLCKHYIDTGHCKFGQMCKFHHPDVSFAGRVPAPVPVPPLTPPEGGVRTRGGRRGARGGGVAAANGTSGNGGEGNAPSPVSPLQSAALAPPLLSHVANGGAGEGARDGYGGWAEYGVGVAWEGGVDGGVREGGVAVVGGGAAIGVGMAVSPGRGARGG